MTETVDLEIAQATLGDLIAGLGPNDELVVTKGNKPIARITATTYGVPMRGRCKGMLSINTDGDDPLEDFKDYMP